MRKATFIRWIGLSLLLILAAIGFWSVSSGTVFAQPPDEASVTFPDRILEAVIRWAIAKPTGPIYISDVAALTWLAADSSSISDLTGLEYFIGLEVLDLKWNYNISDISPLAGLTNLKELDLGGNKISDISPLARLTNLQELDLDKNSISDISPLAGLTNLKELDLFENRISDISPLAGLTNLEELELRDNPLSAASLRFGVHLLQKSGVDVFVWTDPDWLLIAGSFIPLAGAGLAPICYLATRQRRKWLRPAALVMGVMGAVLLALWLLPAATCYSIFGASSVPEGIAVFLVIVACLITLTGAAVGWRRELSGGILLIAGGLIAGVAYPFWLFLTPSILITLFPLVSGLLYLLSWRERPGRTTVESIEKAPNLAQPRKRLRHALLILGIVIVGPIGLLGILFFWLMATFMQSATSWEDYFFWLHIEAWCLAFTCSILAARKYW